MSSIAHMERIVELIGRICFFASNSRESAQELATYDDGTRLAAIVRRLEDSVYDGVMWQYLLDQKMPTVTVAGVAYGVETMAVLTSKKAWCAAMYARFPDTLGPTTWRPDIYGGVIEGRYVPRACTTPVTWNLDNTMAYMEPCVPTTRLFATLLLGIQRLEQTAGLPEAHHAMLEEMLGCWTLDDDDDLLVSVVMFHDNFQ